MTQRLTDKEVLALLAVCSGEAEVPKSEQTAKIKDDRINFESLDKLLSSMTFEKKIKTLGEELLSEFEIILGVGKYDEKSLFNKNDIQIIIDRCSQRAINWKNLSKEEKIKLLSC